MKLINLFFFLSVFYTSPIVFAQSIVVVNIQYLIDNNSILINTIKAMEESQSNILNKLKIKEDDLNKVLQEIENSKLIVNESELNIQIDNYNNSLNDFSIIVEEFNIHYQNQIIFMREKILKEIIILLENYAIKNQIDLILDSNSYLIASNSINITKDIEKLLNEVKIELVYESFEKN